MNHQPGIGIGIGMNVHSGIGIGRVVSVEHYIYSLLNGMLISYLIECLYNNTEPSDI